jgi:hypothetical protein
MQTFRAKLLPVPHGGQYVEVPAAVAAAAGLTHAARVRGTVNGVPYRSSLMKYSGVFHLGLHKPVLAKAAVAQGARVEVSIERDDEPMPTDVVPEDFAKLLKRDRAAANAWDVLRPSRKREYVKLIVEAKKPETRVRRLHRVMALLTASGDD